jgi:hypothetical protein
VSRADRFVGAMLIIVVASWTFLSVCRSIERWPDWLGLMFAISATFSGLMIGRSVWRDRL